MPGLDGGVEDFCDRTTGTEIAQKKLEAGCIGDFSP